MEKVKNFVLWGMHPFSFFLSLCYLPCSSDIILKQYAVLMCDLSFSFAMALVALYRKLVCCFSLFASPFFNPPTLIGLLGLD